MTTIKILGTGCPTCRRLLSDVQHLVNNNNWQAKVEYITDISAVLAYGVMSTPALVINDKVVSMGHPGIPKVTRILKDALEA